MSIFNHFKHLNLSPGQETALTKLEAFISSSAQVFMLKGYAGSGKTTVLKGLVEYLNSIKKDFALMAPTGRAAKVVRERTGKEAFTVHKSIYSYEDLVGVKDGDSFCYYFKIRNNTDVTNKIFIVDEASMLSDASSEGEFFRFGTGHLLSDLISYTRINQPGAISKIIFVGDPCQLPPVNDNSSKAFDVGYLQSTFNLTSEEVEMTEVKRQGGESGILNAASRLRKGISAGYFNNFDLRDNANDIHNPGHEDFLDTWDQVSGTKIIIAYKNKTCLDLNIQIRHRRFGNGHLPIQKGEIVIMGGNNYPKGIFNGEFAVVNSSGSESIVRDILLRGKKPVRLLWRTVELVFPGEDGRIKNVEGKILENFLVGDNYLTPEEMKALYVDFCIRHPKLKVGTEEFKEAIRQDDFFNCLKMKFGYAVTCHKAQGGEWNNVFTIWDHDQREGINYMADKQGRNGKTNAQFYRWAYTAVTRAVKNLYAINPPYFNSYSSMSFLETPVINALNELTGNQVQAEEIVLDEELLLQLQQFGLLGQPLPLQDHFIKTRYAVRKKYIEVTNWQKLGYEIRYTFSRENDKAVFKTFVNGQFEFRQPIAAMPAQSPNETFNSEIVDLLNCLPNVSIKRETADTIIGKIEFDTEVEEKLPFTKILFDHLEAKLFYEKVVIERVDHQLWKERYTFTRNEELAVVDFEYNKDGFFGRVVPLQNKSNSPRLLLTIQQVVQTLKQHDHALQ